MSANAHYSFFRKFQDRGIFGSRSGIFSRLCKIVTSWWVDNEIRWSFRLIHCFQDSGSVAGRFPDGGQNLLKTRGINFPRRGHLPRVSRSHAARSGTVPRAAGSGQGDVSCFFAIRWGWSPSALELLHCNASARRPRTFTWLSSPEAQCCSLRGLSAAKRRRIVAQGGAKRNPG